MLAFACCRGAEDDMWLQEVMLGCDTELFETVRKAGSMGTQVDSVPIAGILHSLGGTPLKLQEDVFRNWHPHIFMFACAR